MGRPRGGPALPGRVTCQRKTNDCFRCLVAARAHVRTRLIASCMSPGPFAGCLAPRSCPSHITVGAQVTGPPRAVAAGCRASWRRRFAEELGSFAPPYLRLALFGGARCVKAVACTSCFRAFEHAPAWPGSLCAGFVWQPCSISLPPGCLCAGGCVLPPRRLTGFFVTSFWAVMPSWRFNVGSGALAFQNVLARPLLPHAPAGYAPRLPRRWWCPWLVPSSHRAAGPSDFLKSLGRAACTGRAGRAPST